MNAFKNISAKISEVLGVENDTTEKAANSNGGADEANSLPVAAGRRKNALEMLDNISRAIVGNTDPSEENVDHVARGPVNFGLVVSLFFLLFGLGWACFAPIDSAAIASGVVVVDSNKKTVQHLEGGIIAEILVHDGDKVEKDQPLMKLNETEARARVALIDAQVAAQTVSEARLLAERDGRAEITFPNSLLEKSSNPEIYALIDGEKRLFETRKNTLEGRISVLKQKAAQLQDEIVGLEAQETAATEQSRLLSQEVGVVEKLVESGQGTRPRLLELQRRLASIEGQKGEYRSSIAKAKQAIGETELEITNTREKFLNDVVSELKEVQNKLSDLKERTRAVADIADRITIRAPQAGIVTNARIFTVGGVIQAGAPIMDIVPQDEQLVIEAHVQPTDIDVVHAGLKARVRLTAFKSRLVPIVEGEVINVSPDRIQDQATREVYFKARVKLDEKMLKNLTQHVALYPGMPADVLIVTGERTFMQYFLSPITDSFNKSFREQ